MAEVLQQMTGDHFEVYLPRRILSVVAALAYAAGAMWNWYFGSLWVALILPVGAVDAVIRMVSRIEISPTEYVRSRPFLPPKRVDLTRETTVTMKRGGLMIYLLPYRNLIIRNGARQEVLDIAWWRDWRELAANLQLLADSARQ